MPMKKRLKLFSTAGIILLVVSFALVALNSALATGMSNVSVTQTTYAASTAVATTTIVFDPETEVNSNDGILITFESDYDISSVVDDDVAVSQTNSGVDITKGTAAVSGQDLQIPITTEGDTPAGQITVTISNSHITNPTSSGTYTVTIKTYDLGDDNAFGGADANADTLEDTGAAAVIIGTNQVTISGTVDPSLSLSLSGTSCALGTLSSANIQTCQYDSTVSTNASSGYTAYIKEDGNLRNASNDIDDVADSTTDAGSEEYGLSTSESDTVDITATNSSATCTTNDDGTTPTNAQALTTSDQSFATQSAPVDSDVVTLCHSASISGTTPAGAYSHTVTVTVVGNF